MFANVVGSGAADGAEAVYLLEYINSQFDPSLDWETINWIRSIWTGPVILKGAQSAEGANLHALARVLQETDQKTAYRIPILNRLCQPSQGLESLGQALEHIVAANPGQAAQYRAGKTKVMGFLVGQVMKASAGKANPGQVNALLRARLES